MSFEIVQYRDSDIQATQLADLIADELRNLLKEKGRATLAVPGGTTPGPFLTALSKQELDWSNVAITLTDERWVGEDNPRSNFALLKRTLKQNRAKTALFLPLYRETASTAEVLTEIGNDLQPYLPLDICVFGMGDDMHTASLFPNAEGLDLALDENATSMLAFIRPKGLDETRITFSAPAFIGAQHHHVLIKGANKHKALLQAQECQSTSEAPIRLILDRPATQVHYAP